MNSLYLNPVVSLYANDNDAMIPEIWANMGLAILEENMVAAALVHRDFSPEVAQFGDVVNTRRPGQFKIRRKGDNDPVVGQDAITNNVRVPLDQHFYTNFTIKDGEASKSFQDLVDIHLLPGMQNIARAIDRAILGRVSTISQKVLFLSLRYPMFTASAMVPDDVIRTKVMMAIRTSGIDVPNSVSANTSLGTGQGSVVDIRTDM